MGVGVGAELGGEQGYIYPPFLLSPNLSGISIQVRLREWIGFMSRYRLSTWFLLLSLHSLGINACKWSYYPTIGIMLFQAMFHFLAGFL